MSLDLIIPVCGKSTRYPGETPKWALKRNNLSMLQMAVSGLSGYSRLFVVYLKKHKEFIKYSVPENAILVELPEYTSSQCETIYKSLSIIDSNKFVVKDCDNYFKYDLSNIDDNFVGYYKLDNMTWTNVANKSYLEIQDSDYLEKMVEKKMISRNFGVGFYGFQDRNDFCNIYTKDKSEYISSIMDTLIHKGKRVKCLEVKDYIDWGTIHDWNYNKNNCS